MGHEWCGRGRARRTARLEPPDAEDAMATEKLSEGIRGFAADLRKLEDFIRPSL